MKEIAEEDRYAALALWVELGKPEAALPTLNQLVAFLRRCPDVVALNYAERFLENQETATDCWIRDHEGQLEYYRAAAEALRRVLALADEFDAGVPWPRSWIGNRIREAAGVEK